MNNVPADEKIAPAVATCHARRKTGRVLKKERMLGFEKN
jgi:hypothetical protein